MENKNYYMKLKASMVKITWNFSKIDRRIYNVGNIYKVKKIEEVKTHKDNEKLGVEDGSDWVTFTHYRDIDSKDYGIRQIAFKVEETNWFKDNINKNIIFEINSNIKGSRGTPLQYDKESGYWFEPACYVCKDGKYSISDNENFSVTGIKEAGCFRIVVSSTINKLKHESPKIKVLPSCISLENYEQMLNDLIYYRYDLIENRTAPKSTINLQHKVNGKVSKDNNFKEEFNIDKVNNILDDLSIYLNRIDKKPKVMIKRQWVKEINHSIRKMASKTMKEKLLKPYSNKYTVPKYEECLDIYENQFIKSFLWSLKKAVCAYSKYYIKMHENELKELKKELGEICNKYGFNLNENKDLKMNMEKKKFYDNAVSRNNRMESLEKFNLKKSFEDCISKIEKLLNINFIRNTTLIHNMKLRASQIFANDKNYLTVWKDIISLKNNCTIYEYYKDIHVFINDTERIYEYWCLFRMISILVNRQKWQLVNSDSLMKLLNSYLSSKADNKIEGFYVDLKHNLKEKNECVKLRILFNYKWHTFDNKYKIPDFTFKFNLNSNNTYVYMDAKYRNYTEQTIKQWRKDIKDVAINKYIKDFKGTNHETVASFIIHSDSNSEYTNYGGYKIDNVSDDDNWPNHRYGAICLLPNENEKFITLMKMIMEYHLKLFEICWNCGESENVDKEPKKTRSGYDKNYYRCKSCGEFWVESHCDNHDEHHRLIKHLNNYHCTQDNNPWYVYCPVGM